MKEKNSKIKKSLSQLEEYYKNFKIKIENLKQEITATNENWLSKNQANWINKIIYPDFGWIIKWTT